MSNQAIQENIKRWRHDPTAFDREVLGIEFIPQWQLDCDNAIKAGHLHITISSGHGVGKSNYLARRIVWFLSTRYPAKVPCTAPTGHQLEDVLWSELAIQYRRLPEAFKAQFEITRDKFFLKGAQNESFAVARTARKESPEALQGFHSENLMFIPDEASGIPEIIFETAQGALSTKGSLVIMPGNPTRADGYFYDAHHKNKADWFTRVVSCYELIAEGAPYVDPEFPDKIGRQYGYDSQTFGVRVLGEFPSSNPDAIIPKYLIMAAVERKGIEPLPIRPVWGLDVAGGGKKSDKSALAKRQGNVLLEPVKTWNDLDPIQLANAVEAIYLRTPALQQPEFIMVDSIGLGAGTAARLREMGLPAKSINVGSTSTDPRYAKIRDELHYTCLEWFQQADCIIPHDTDLIEELAAARGQDQIGGKMKALPKDNIKEIIGRSPDRADAKLLTFAAPRRTTGLNKIKPATSTARRRKPTTHYSELEFNL
jgi:hypothetical protein